ncbi:MAG TPA: class I SAM-dependent methyltransferase [Terriglobales bacterium]|nr:class I SAM-dependent methyltransferase [Terriglobales bacterium]
MSTPPSPALVFDTLNAYQRTEALRAALELDVFTAIGAGTDSASALAKQTGASERGLRILADYLTAVGFLTKKDNHYGLTPDSAMFLDRRSPACVASAVGFLASPGVMSHYVNLAAAVRKGGTAAEADGLVAPEHGLWVDFARSMQPMMVLPGELIARLLSAERGDRWKVLDIAAGHGIFGVTLARLNPNAEIVAVDWPNVLEVAKENARAAGVEQRYQTRPGSAMDVDFGEGYDLVLLTNFLHHFDVSTNEGVLRKVHAALKPGGRAVILELVPNEDRVSPPLPAMFALIMLASTPAGDAYTFAEYREMLQHAGFASSQLHPLPPTFQHVVIATK